MVMDYIKQCYYSKMRPYRDRPDILVRGRWWWCPPGAKPLPFPHAFGSAGNEPDAEFEDPEIGEVWDWGGIALSPPNPRYLGQNYCGKPEEWSRGVYYSQRGTPPVDVERVPLCCITTPLRPGGATISGSDAAVNVGLFDFAWDFSIAPGFAPIPAVAGGIGATKANHVTPYRFPAKIAGEGAGVITGPYTVYPAKLGGEGAVPAPAILDLKSGLKAWWGCHESSGNRLDSSGNSHTLFEDIAGPVGSMPGLIGTAASYDGSSFLLTSSFAWNTPPWTIAGWWISSQIDPGGLMSLYANGFPSVWLDFANGGNMNIGPGEGPDGVANDPSAWQLSILSYDGTNVRFYRNGLLRLFVPSSAAPPASGPFAVGAPWASAANFIGGIQLVGIWNRILFDGGSSAPYTPGGEIALLWNGGAGADYPF